MSKVGDNPNDKMPAGKPLDPDRIVSEEDAGSASIEEEMQEEKSERDVEHRASKDGTTNTADLSVSEYDRSAGRL